MKYEAFITRTGLEPENFRWAWAFCNEVEGPITEPELADELLDLVLTGKKTATASALAEYAPDEAQPVVDGKFDVLLDGKGVPRAAIRTTRVTIRKFKEVSAAHAFKEGEGDRSLSYWRQAHQEFWENLDLFQEEMDVICEEFEVLYQE